MPQHEFNIIIEPNGSVHLQVQGMNGKTCLEAVKLFERIAGELKSAEPSNPFPEPDSWGQAQHDSRINQMN
jgi:hypothetical protein